MSGKSKTDKKVQAVGEKRSFQTTAIDQLLGASLGGAARKRGFADEKILAEWERIVGSQIAKRCQPLKIVHSRGHFGTLHVMASGAAALELQHLAPQIIDRINRHFGHQAVRRMQIIQSPLPKRRGVDKKPVNKHQADLEEAARQTSKVDDGGLRAALERLHITLQEGGRFGGRDLEKS